MSRSRIRQVNFQISEDHMDKATYREKDILHLYVDGKQKAMIGKTGPLTLTNLAAGKHEIRLELQQNDHKDTQCRENSEY